MKKLQYKTTIRASAQKVWNAMTDKETYKEWVGPSWPDSFYEGEWKEGEKLRFIGPDGSGTLGEVVKQKEYEHTLIKHIAILREGGVEDTNSDAARGWIGTSEGYTFNEKNGATELVVDIETKPAWEQMFNEGWPGALSKLKEMCEK